MRAMFEAGRAVPRDVSVVGFDDVPFARYLTPPLTTVRQDFEEIGRRSVHMLLDAIDGAGEDGHARDDHAAADHAGEHRAGAVTLWPRLSGTSGAVLLVGDVLAPDDGAPSVVGLLHGDVDHEAIGGAPCQWFSPGSKNTRSPGRIVSTGPP